jgi:hypothetical protein
VAWQLEEGGYRVLIQAWDFVPGTNWQIKMDEGVRRATRTIAILSRAYLDSVYGKVEWQSAQAADPKGFARKLLPIRIEDCERPGLLAGVVSIDLFRLARDDASQHLLRQIDHTVTGRAKPASAPQYPVPANPVQPADKPAFPPPASVTATSSDAIPPEETPATALPFASNTPHEHTENGVARTIDVEPGDGEPPPTREARAPADAQYPGTTVKLRRREEALWTAVAIQVSGIVAWLPALTFAEFSWWSILLGTAWSLFVSFAVLGLLITGNGLGRISIDQALLIAAALGGAGYCWEQYVTTVTFTPWTIVSLVPAVPLAASLISMLAFQTFRPIAYLSIDGSGISMRARRSYVRVPWTEIRTIWVDEQGLYLAKIGQREEPIGDAQICNVNFRHANALVNPNGDLRRIEDAARIHGGDRMPRFRPAKL